MQTLHTTAPVANERPALPRIACSLTLDMTNGPANVVLKLYTSAVVGPAAILGMEVTDSSRLVVQEVSVAHQ
jgi:hypothetical protein